MPVLYQKYIHRNDLQSNPEILYVFGDNTERRGFKGQAAAMRGEPNAVGIATKWQPTMHPGAFFADDKFEAIRLVIDKDLKRLQEHLRKGGTVVIPSDGLGTGLSDLPNKAPKVFEYLCAQLNDLSRL